MYQFNIMTDKFEEFENNLYNWILRHKFELFSVGLVVVVWVMLSICVVTMWGIIGMSNAEYYTIQAYNGVRIDNPLFISNETYNTTMNFLIPTSVIMFDTIRLVGLIFACGYVILLFYMSIKYVWRKRDEEYNY